MTTSHIDLGSFAHPAFFYHSMQDYLDCLVPFVTAGLDAGYPVLAALPGANLAMLRDALGGDTNPVTLLDMAQDGRNPGRILGGVLSAFAVQHAPQPVRMIGEPIWPRRSPLEYPACVQHEALINRAFAGHDVIMLCPYDATHLEADVLADARITHPTLWYSGLPEQVSPDFAPESVWQRYNQPLPQVSTAATYIAECLSDLHGARGFAVRYARRYGLSPDRIADLQLIVTELAANSLQHADGPCAIALWHQDGNLVCEARDSGHLADPMAGRRPVHRDSARGRGLYLVNAIADLVRTHTAPGGTTTRAYLGLQTP